MDYGSPPEAVQDGGCRRRRLLAQRLACCPGLPRGLVRVPATRTSSSAAHAPCAIELPVGRALQARADPTSTKAAYRGGSCELRTWALSPRLVRSRCRTPVLMK